MDLLQYINSKVKLSAEEGSTIDAAFKREFLHRGTILADPGNRSQKVHFIEKGMVRTFYNKDGKDITHFFFAENSFTMSLESIYFNKTDPYGREVLEETTLRTIHFTEFNALLNDIDALKSLFLIIAIGTIKVFSDKLFSLQFQTAEQRYKSMIDNYPNILLKVPLGHIASYLGITQQTLSVIRAQK